MILFISQIFADYVTKYVSREAIFKNRVVGIKVLYMKF